MTKKNRHDRFPRTQSPNAWPDAILPNPMSVPSSDFAMIHDSQCSSPPRLASLDPLSRACHFSPPTSFPGRVVRLQDPSLRFVCLAECIAPLLPHPLHLAHFPNRFLELLHPGSVVLNVVLLNLLDVVIGLGPVHAFRVFPSEITH